MKFALYGGKKVEAEATLKGALCPVCDAVVIAKCGDKNIHHWAHKSNKECPHWWENETKWHRDWKNHFPLEWQEIVHTSKTGEKHIADIKTPNGLVVEFQHSSIEKKEVSTRNAFYENIIWIVDGKRRKYDERNLSQHAYDGKSNSRLINEWGNTGKLIFFDFGKSILPYLEQNIYGNYEVMVTPKKELIKWIYKLSIRGKLFRNKYNQSNKGFLRNYL